MLVDISVFLDENLERAQRFFADPKNQLREHPLDEDGVRTIFGYEMIQPGVYWTSGNTDNFLREIVDQEKRFAREWLDVSPYGSADNPDQVVAYAKPDMIETPCEIFVTPLARKYEPKSGGWRWEKNGPYIGTQESTSDYLAHEEHIEEIVVWRIIPFDPAKLASALEARQSPTPGL